MDKDWEKANLMGTAPEKESMEDESDVWELIFTFQKSGYNAVDIKFISFSHLLQMMILRKRPH